MFKSSNPTMRPQVFQDARGGVMGSAGTMTIDGTVNKAGIMLVIMVATASFTWSSGMGPLFFVGLIGGLITAIATAFKPNWAPVSAPIYAAFEGLFLGGLTGVVEAMYPGIAFQAIFLTFGVLATLLVAYRLGFVRATQKFRAGVMAATGAIFLVYMVSIGLSFFGIAIPLLHTATPIGIGISLFVVIIAALNLVLDFDFIEKGAQSGAPKSMEWYGAFTLMVTLVWLYVEMLRLLRLLAAFGDD